MANAIVQVVDGRAVVSFSGPEAISTMLAQAQGAVGDADSARVAAETARDAAVAATADKLNKGTVNALTDSFYGVGDGATDDTAAVQAANAAGGVVYVPEGRFKTGLGFYDLLNARFTGEGQVVLDGYAQARDRSFMTSDVQDVSYDRQRIFDGDWSKAHNVRYAFRGGNVGKSPISAYRNLTLASPEITVLDFTGGVNTDLADHAGGRTGMTDRYRLLYHGGQGDIVGETFFGEVYSVRAGATHWLANPALIVQNGGLGAVGAATGAFLNHSEFIFSDSGLAVSAIDRVRNYNRTNAGAGQYQVWVHDRPQSSGSVPVDVAYAPAGAWPRGIDTAAASFESGAWAATKRGDYRYMDATSTPDPLGGKFYSDDLGDTFDGIVGDTYTLALGSGIKWRVSGVKAFTEDAAASAAGLGSGHLYVNSVTGAVSFNLQRAVGQSVIWAKGSAPATLTGSTAETALATINIPGALLGSNGVLRVTTFWNCNNNANAKTIRVRFGGTLFGDQPMANNLSLVSVAHVVNRSATSQFGGGRFGSGGFGGTGVALPTGTVNSAANQPLTITAQLANGADTATLEGYIVELLR